MLNCFQFGKSKAPFFKFTRVMKAVNFHLLCSLHKALSIKNALKSKSKVTKFGETGFSSLVYHPVFLCFMYIEKFSTPVFLEDCTNFVVDILSRSLVLVIVSFSKAIIELLENILLSYFRKPLQSHSLINNIVW